MNGVDRNHLKVLVAIADHGSLTGAARALQLSQPTLGRIVGRLEDSLGFPVVVRHARGVRLTERAQTLVPLAREAEAGVARFLRRAQGLEGVPGGCVRVSASEIIAVEVLPQWAATLRQSHPQIQVGVVAANNVADLSRGDADVAVRMFRPTGDHLVAQKLGETPLALYASRQLAQRLADDRRANTDGSAPPVPTTTPTARWMTQAPIVFFDSDPYFREAAAAMAADIADEQRVFRSDSLCAQLAGVRAGLGVGGLQLLIAQRYPELVQLSPPMARLEVWLTTHADLRLSQRIRIVYESLRDYLGPRLASLRSRTVTPPVP